jgi:LysM repeat protein
VWGIAKDHGVTVKEVMRVNPGLDATRLQVGMRVRVPLR